MTDIGGTKESSIVCPVEKTILLTGLPRTHAGKNRGIINGENSRGKRYLRITGGKLFLRQIGWKRKELRRGNKCVKKNYFELSIW